MKGWKQYSMLLLAAMLLAVMQPINAGAVYAPPAESVSNYVQTSVQVSDGKAAAVQAASAVKLNYKKKKLTVGKTFTLKLTGAKVKSFTSSDKKIASVSKKGVVTAKKAGTATIKVKAKNGKTYQCKVTCRPSQSQAYKKIIAKKKKYPEGMKWTNDNYYAWKGGVYSAGYGCAAFAFLLSDAAFGTLPAKTHENYDDIRAGDILRLYNDSHSVIVLKVSGDTVTLAEGNFNGKVHWGRTMTLDEVKENCTYVMTRY